MVCEKNHWKVGRYRAEYATLAATGSVAMIEEALEGEGAGMAEGNGGEVGSGRGGGRKTECGNK